MSHIYNKETKKGALNIKKSGVGGLTTSELMGLSHKASGLLGTSISPGKVCRMVKKQNKQLKNSDNIKQ